MTLADLGVLPSALGQAAAFVADRDVTRAQYRHRLADAKDLVDVVPEPRRPPQPRPVA